MTKTTNEEMEYITHDTGIKMSDVKCRSLDYLHPFDTVKMFWFILP